jgi:hypothetical protein
MASRDENSIWLPLLGGSKVLGSAFRVKFLLESTVEGNIGLWRKA